MPPTDDPRSDSALIAAAARGDREAFGALYLRHREFVYRVALRYAREHGAAMDAAQDVFLHLIARIPTLRLTGRLTTYLYPVAKNLALARVRAEGNRLRILRERAPGEAGAGGGAGGESAMDPALERALGGLAPEHREVLLMRVVDEMSVAEVAAALSIPEGTVKSRLHHALGRLREDAGVRPLME